MTLETGRRLGPYEIVASLGAGGMGEVYEAKDIRLGRTVAIKVLPEGLAENPERKARFEREARTVSQLSHPHVCTLHDVGEEEGLHFLVLEHCEGETLSQRLERGALSLADTLRYGAQIAEALDAAHRRGVVHRDLKPANVMLTATGVKLLDFGLARVAARVSSEVRDLPTMTLDAGLAPTRAGMVIGTLPYMAPEQARGEAVDHRADIFALGAVIWEMATGERAFSGPSSADVVSAVLRQDPAPLSEASPGTPRSLGRIVSRCLEKIPDARFQSAGDLGFALRELSFPRVSRAEEAPHSASRHVMRFELPPPEDAMLTSQLALAPDGSRLAFVATVADGLDLLWVRPLDSLEAVPLPRTEGAAFPFWAPDSRSLAFFADGELKRVDPGSFQAPRTLCRAPLPRGGTWSPGGTIVFTTAMGGEVRAVSAAGGEPRPIEHLVSREGELYRWPSFLPDGERFLCFVLSEDPEVTGVHLTSVDSGATHRVAKADWGGLYAPPGFLLFRVGDQMMCQPFDADQGRTRGPARPVVENVRWDGTSNLLTACTVSANGVLAYLRGGLATSELVWHDRDGDRGGVVGPDLAYLEPALSPDGGSVAIPGIRSGGSLGLQLIDADRGTGFPIATGAEPAVTPLWSPDGHKIAYSLFPSGKVMVTSASGSAAQEPLFEPEVFSPLTDWSRDGRFVFHDRLDFRTFRSEILVHDLERGESRTIVSGPFSSSFARLSPNGRWLAYQTEASGSPEIVVQDFPGLEDRIQVSIGGGTQVRWRGDGRELYYVSPDRKIMAVEVEEAGEGESFRTGDPKPLFQTRILPLVEARNHYDVTADGQRFLVNSRRSEEASLTIALIVDWPATIRD